MAPITSRWSFDPDLFPLSERASLLSGIRLDLDEDTVSEQVQRGAFWVLPFARTSADDPIGVRLTPGTAASASLVVVSQAPEVDGWASSPQTFVPTSLFWQARRSQREWDEIAECDRTVREELLAFHHGLGGTDLDALHAVLADRTLRDACVRHGTEEADQAIERALARVDPPCAPFWRAAIALRLDGQLPSSLPVDAWTPALTAVVLGPIDESVARGGDLQANDVLVEAAWLRVNLPAGLEARRLTSPSTRTPDLATLHLRAARLLVGSASPAAVMRHKDPLWPAIEATLQAGDRYDGSAHLMAAAALERAGQPERAWGAYATAAGWSTIAHGTANPAALIGARALAGREHWDEIVEALDRIPL